MRLHSEQLSKKIGKIILDCYDFDEEETHLLDFACGRGSISQFLASECKSILGIDIDQDTVDIYNRRVADQGISNDEMKAICLDLIAQPEFIHDRFNVIVCSQAYHHVQDIVQVTRVLASLLKQQGKLIVVDLLKDETSICLKDAGTGPVPHKGGLTKDEIKNAFGAADLQQIEFRLVLEIGSLKKKVKLFAITGVC